MFSFGSGEKGQLGNGKTGEHIVTGGKTVFDAEWEPSQSFQSSMIFVRNNVVFPPLSPSVPVKGLDDKNIVQIACGQQHTIALDDTGSAHPLFPLNAKANIS